MAAKKTRLNRDQGYMLSMLLLVTENGSSLSIVCELSLYCIQKGYDYDQ